MDGVTLFDMTHLQPGIKGYSGVVSDGRYFYFIPLNNGDFFGTVARFDIAKPFDETASWDTFDSTQLDGGSRGFIDGLFDGRYLYLIPFCNDKHHGQITRYDTQKPFDEQDSWRVFDSTAIHPNSRGFVSGCFDGRYIYLSPYQLDHSTHHGQVTRYDTQGGFSDPGSWQVFDTAQVHADSRGFHSAVSDGKYVYFIPYLRDGGEHSSMLLCYDLSQGFEHPGAWQAFDMAALGEQCRGYIGAVYHKGMLYFAPYRNNEQRHGNVLRFNTDMKVQDLAAWTVFDCARVEPGSRGFFGALCDQDYLYLLPHCRALGQYHGQLARYRLSGAFDDPDSWSVCDLALADPACRGFIGGVIHQQHLYLAPFETDTGCHSGLAARLDLNLEQVWQQPALEAVD
ncbi:hypothetical protein [Thalassomonas sp. RHCl1]|uniref:hypothetical protein n=1 Tax=Thalassomonas sp. RHCl1 TaxID=2995320 RepID=UPI00248BA3A3|nr:hypothetical protein [Thalassomonas sp. RHCl1]